MDYKRARLSITSGGRWLRLMTSVLLASMMGIAGFSKLSDLTSTRESFDRFGVPKRLAGTLAITVPLLEVLVAVCLLLPRTKPVGQALLGFLLAVFSTAISMNRFRGRTAECACFGQYLRSLQGDHALRRNVALTLLLVLGRPAAEAVH